MLSPQHTLWDPNTTVPERSALKNLEGTQFVQIRSHPREAFVHGANLSVVEGQIWCSFAHNDGAENTRTETARMRVSADAGQSWGEDMIIDEAYRDYGVSHGVFASVEGGTQMAFHPTVSDGNKSITTQRYEYDPGRRTWTGPVWVADGFWPLQEPQRLPAGNFVMAGVWKSDNLAKTETPPAVLISRDDKMQDWQLVIPYVDCTDPYWGESSLLVDGEDLLLVARSSRQSGVLLAANSSDGGRSWTPVTPSNLPFTSSKPHIGRLSSGVPYLVGTSYKDVKGERSVLTISLGEAKSHTFSSTWAIRFADQHDLPDPSSAGWLSYPHAIEWSGKLYIAYSNDGGRGVNKNSLELAILDVEDLTALAR